MKKIGRAMLAAVLVCMAAGGLIGCADADGLHNQPELLVTFEFSGFGDVSGDYAIPGNFVGNDSSWQRGVDATDVVLKNGAGTSTPISVISSNIQFSLCPKGEWTRPWYKAGSVEGNGSDSGTMQNFYIDDLDLSAGELTVIVAVDETGVAVPRVK